MSNLKYKSCRCESKIVKGVGVWGGGSEEWKFLLNGPGSFRVFNAQNMSNELRLEFIFTSVMNNSKILRK